jgi:ATP-dependent helicase/nuclease subunit A
MPAEYFAGSGATEMAEKVIVQGIIDLLLETPDGLIVVDFKTDRIVAAQTHARATVYASQMNLYALAAGKVLKRPIKAKYLYFLIPAQCVALFGRSM